MNKRLVLSPAVTFCHCLGKEGLTHLMSQFRDFRRHIHERRAQAPNYLVRVNQWLHDRSMTGVVSTCI